MGASFQRLLFSPLPLNGDNGMPCFGHLSNGLIFICLLSGEGVLLPLTMSIHLVCVVLVLLSVIVTCVFQYNVNLIYFHCSADAHATYCIAWKLHIQI